MRYIAKEWCDGPFGSGIASEHYRDGGARVIRLQNIKSLAFDGHDEAFIDEHYFQESLFRHAVEQGDVLIAGLGDDNNLVGRACVAPEGLGPALVKADCFRFRLERAKADSRFVAYSLCASAAKAAGELAGGSTRQRINLSSMAGRKVLLPRLDEQERIANFLDEQTARIDALIAEKEQLLVLLTEQRLSIAERVLADSANGQKAKLGFHVDLLPGYAFPSEEFSRDEGNIPLLRGVNVAPACIRWDDVVYWPKDYDSSLERFRLQAGDVVFGMDRPWISSGARVAMVDASAEGAFLLQRVCRLRGGVKLRQRFLFYALASDAFRQSVEVDLTGVSVPHISPEQVLGFKVPVLSPAEQDARCAAADRQTAKLFDLEAHTNEMLERLHEYRSSLISAAVTGQLDISTFKAAA